MLTIKTTGFDTLERQMKEMQNAMDELGEELGTVKFNPSDPLSIESAIQQIEQTIDDRVGNYATNSMLASVIEGLKETFRDGIIEQAANARFEQDTNK